MKHLLATLLAAGFLALLTSITRAEAPSTPALDELPLKQSVTRNGITWTFDKPAHVGQFITGDLYVVGPVTITEIDPRPLFGDEVKSAPDKSDDGSERRIPRPICAERVDAEHAGGGAGEQGDQSHVAVGF